MADEIKAGVEIVSTTGTIELVDSSKDLTQWDLNRRINIFGYENAQYVHFWHTVESKGYTVKIKEENGQRYAEIPNIMLQVVGDITVYISNGEWSVYQAKLTMKANEGGNDEQYNNSYSWTEIVLKSDIEYQKINLDGYIWQQYQTATNEQTLLNTKGEPTGFYVINDDPDYLPTNGYNEADNYWYVQLETIATENFVKEEGKNYAISSEKNGIADKSVADSEGNNIVETYIKKNEGANALKRTKTGVNAIRIDDISPIEHNIKITAKSKNLLASPFGAINVENGKQYTFSFKLKDGIELPADAHYYFCWYIKEGYWQNAVLINSGNIDETEHIFIAGFNGNYGYYIDYGNITEDMFEYAQLEEGSTATAYTPYVDVSEAKLYKTGKNLIPYPYKQTNYIVNGITFTDNGDGTITANGTATNGNAQYLIIPSSDNYILPSGAYAVSGCPAGGSNTTYGIWTPYNREYGKGITFTTDGKTLFYLNITIVAGTTVNNLVFKPQLEIGTIATEHELYIKPVEVDKDNVTSLYPTTTLYSDTSGLLIKATYNRDINKAFEELYNAIISMGGNI